MPSGRKIARSPEITESLRSRFMGGDDAAFEELLNDYMPLLKHVAHKYCLQRNEREDCLAEAILGFWHAIRTYNPQRGGLDSYVMTVSSRRLIDMGRRRSRTHVVILDDLDNVEGAHTDPDRGCIDDMPQLMSTLSELERKCFERYQRGEHLAGIAMALGVTKASVSNSLARAKRKLSRGLG